MPEEIQEHGIVVQTCEGLATVSVVRSGACEECGARILCKSSGEENPHVTALDTMGVKPGDRVRICAPGKNVLLASVYLYGIPLVLLLLGITLGAALPTRNTELIGSLLGLGFCALYYIIVRILSGNSRRNRRFMPRIDKIL